MLLGAVAAVLLWPSRTPPPAPPIPEVDRTQLVLDNGKLRRTNETAPFIGWMTSTYPGGAPQSRSMVSNGVLHGISQGWHTNGTLQITEFFENGVSHGTRTKYFESGATQSVGHVVLGKLEGAFTRYDEQGAVAEEIVLRDGTPDGVSTSYHPNGKIKVRARLEKGVLRESESFDETGNPLPARK